VAPVEIRRSARGGFGVFATAPQNAGSVLMRESLVVQEAFAPDDARARLVGLIENDGRDAAETWLRHSYPDGEAFWHCSTRDAALVNHSASPNCMPDKLPFDESTEWLAQRDIFAGDEITHDYRCLGDYGTPPVWFSAMFQLLGLTFPSVEAMDRGAQPPTSPVGRSSHGALVALDFEGFRVDAAEGSAWLLEMLGEQVAAHKIKEVHRRAVVLPLNPGESPPGFTAVLLIDESHVTAHCYSDRGWLAIDVFTCGGSDPAVLAAAIRRRIEAHVPSAVCVQQSAMPRFLHSLRHDAEPLEERSAPEWEADRVA
jgi:S-adenosylmethionine decarboxylase